MRLKRASDCVPPFWQGVTEKDLIQRPGMGAQVTLRVTGRTLVQTEHFGRSSSFAGWRPDRDSKEILPFCDDPQTLLTAVIEKDLDSGDTTYCHTRFQGPLFAKEFEEKWFDNMEDFEEHIYAIIPLHFVSAFGLHELPCTPDHKWHKRPVYVQGDFVFYGVNKAQKVVTDTGYYFNKTNQKYYFAGAAYCPESGRSVRRGDVVILEGKHLQAPRKVVKVETEPQGDYSESVVVDYDLEKRITVLTHILVACTCPVYPPHLPTQTLFDKPPPHPNPDPNSALVQWTVLGHIFPENKGKGGSKRNNQVPWVLVYARYQRYTRTWTEAMPVCDYETKPDEKEHWGPYVKLVTWDSVGMCVKHGLTISKTDDPAKLHATKIAALKWVLAGVEDPAWTQKHQSVLDAEPGYKERLEKAQKSDQKRINKKARVQMAKHEALVQKLKPDLTDLTGMVTKDEHEEVLNHNAALEVEVEELKKQKGAPATKEQIAARVHRDEFWQAMRAYYFQFQADRNQSLHDKELPRIKLKDLIPVVARQIFSQDELNNLDAL
jgi:hypothetical protein